MFSQKCLDAIGVQPEGWHPQIETYEHLGDVPTRSVDLHARHQELTQARQVFITADEADFAFAVEVNAPPSIVWDWLNDPHKRNLWMSERHWSIGVRPQGRMGAGARNHCAHGKSTLTETILDWRPFEYFTRHQDDGQIDFLETTSLTPTENQHTRVTIAIKFPWRLPLGLKRFLIRFFTTRVIKYDAMYQNMARMIGAEQSK
jgi:uncharacterized protein YndB with AHSA1/START domain